MEVDELGGGSGGGDSENQLVNMFSSMATEDKDNLVTALQGVIGSGVSPANCRFFLELANWNLSAAIGAYYDFDFSQQQQQQQHLQLDHDTTDSCGPRMVILSCQATVRQDDTLAISCTVYNESTCDSPPGCRLVCSPEATDASVSGGVPLCEPCLLPSMRPGGNCSCQLVLPPLTPDALYNASSPSRRVRLRLHAPDGSPLSMSASARCLDLVELATRGRIAEAQGETEADAAAAVAAANWASSESPLAANPPPSPSHTDEQMME